MIDPFAKTSAHANPLSKPALVTAVVLHLGLLWIAMNSAPMVRSAEQVIYQWAAPVTTQREVSGAITLPSPIPAPAVAKPMVKSPAKARAAITEPRWREILASRSTSGTSTGSLGTSSSRRPARCSATGRWSLRCPLPGFWGCWP